MKILTIRSLVAALLAVLSSSAWGADTASADGGPHTAGQGMTTDACAGCHRAHTAKAANLLTVAATDLCYTCHSNGLGAKTNVRTGALTGGGALKAGGFETAWMNTQDPTWSAYVPGWGYDYGGGAEATGIVTIGVITDPLKATVTSRHSIDGSAQIAWGNGPVGSTPGFAGFKLECTSCHDPHGNGNYRALRPLPATQGGATDKSLSGINVPDLLFAKPYVTNNYFTDLPNGISGWCSQCHTRYYAEEDSAKNRLVGDSVFTYRHETAATGAPTCTTCHASHGTNAQNSGGSGPAGANYANGVKGPDDTLSTLAPGEQRTSLLKMDNRGMCQKCHHR